MRIVGFYHSLRSDWNNGNAHFLRGIAWELQRRGHDVRVFEPADGWSAGHLARDHGEAALGAYQRVYPGLRSRVYKPETLDLQAELDGVDLVLVHEWNEADTVRRLGDWRRDHPRARLLFHDTHHRSLTRAREIAAYDLSHYDGVLAFGRVIRDRYRDAGWASRAWTWHEAADVRVFSPLPGLARAADVAWIGNWGDGERTRELQAFLLEPVRSAGLTATAHGVRYPPTALRMLRRAGCTYGGYLPNFRVPHVFARHAVTVHVPRRAYASQLPGIPTIRPFEAMACGVPLVSAPWEDVEGLFIAGRDYLVARTTAEMTDLLRMLVADRPCAEALAARGRETVLARHTCAHRVDELLRVYDEIGPATVNGEGGGMDTRVPRGEEAVR